MTDRITLGQASVAIGLLLKINTHVGCLTHLNALIIVEADYFWCDTLCLLMECTLSVRHLMWEEWCANFKSNVYELCSRLTDIRIELQ